VHEGHTRARKSSKHRREPRQRVGDVETFSGFTSWGCVSAIDSNGRTIWIVDAHRGDGKRYVVHADELLTAFVELDSQRG
jgi:hypothetical protein